MSNYGRLTTLLLAAWFAFALLASAFHLFTNQANWIGVAVAIAALVPVVLFSLWFASSAEFRNFASSLNPRTLTYVQSWRIIGIVFLILAARGVLPSVFALPAGYGDIAIGASAALVAWKLANRAHRTSFILWQALGITDLFLGVGLGTAARALSPESIPMGAMTVLPLSLIPTFLVPLFLILHIICIAQARASKGVPGDTHHWRSSSNRDAEVCVSHIVPSYIIRQR
jgi:hypothetical protein